MALVLLVFNKRPAQGRGQGDFFAGLLVDGHMHGFSCPHHGFATFEGVKK